MLAIGFKKVKWEKKKYNSQLFIPVCQGHIKQEEKFISRNLGPKGGNTGKVGEFFPKIGNPDKGKNSLSGYQKYTVLITM